MCANNEWIVYVVDLEVLYSLSEYFHINEQRNNNKPIHIFNLVLFIERMVFKFLFVCQHNNNNIHRQIYTEELRINELVLNKCISFPSIQYKPTLNPSS